MDNLIIKLTEGMEIDSSTKQLTLDELEEKELFTKNQLEILKDYTFLYTNKDNNLVSIDTNRYFTTIIICDNTRKVGSIGIQYINSMTKDYYKKGNHKCTVCIELYGKEIREYTEDKLNKDSIVMLNVLSELTKPLGLNLHDSFFKDQNYNYESKIGFIRRAIEGLNNRLNPKFLYNNEILACEENKSVKVSDSNVIYNLINNTVESNFNLDMIKRSDIYIRILNSSVLNEKNKITKLLQVLNLKYELQYYILVSQTYDLNRYNHSVSSGFHMKLLDNPTGECKKLCDFYTSMLDQYEEF